LVANKGLYRKLF